MQTTTLYFDQSGPENTKATLQAGAGRATELGIKQIVVATSTGRTAPTAAATARRRSPATPTVGQVSNSLR